MTNPNQRISPPYGDVFMPNTSYTDRAAAQLYAEQKQREAKQEQMNAALDDEFSKNLAGIRDADIPELTQKYTNWKLANIRAMKQKGGISPQQQMDLLRGKADMYDTINGSKWQKQWEEENAKKPVGNLIDNAQELLYQHRKTPISILKSNGQYGFNYNYDGQDYSGKADDLNKSRGDKVTIEDKGMNDPDNKFGKIYNKYQINSAQPERVRDYYIAKMSGDRQARNSYTYDLKNLPPDELTNTHKQFNAIPDSYWDLLGRKKPDLEYKNTDDNAHVWATYMAQKAALDNIPFKVGERKEINDQLSKEADQNFKVKMDAINFEQQKKLKAIDLSNSKELDKAREENKAKGAQADDLWLDNYLDKVDESADKDKSFLSIPKLGIDWKTKGTGKVVANNYLYTQLGKPDEIKLLPDKKYQITYYNYDKDGKPSGVDDTRSGTFSRDDIKLMMGSKAVGKKQLGKEMGNSNESHPPVKQNGVTYTWNAKTQQYE